MNTVNIVNNSSKLLQQRTPNNESRWRAERNFRCHHKNLILEILITQNPLLHYANAPRPRAKVQALPSDQSAQPTMALQNSNQTSSMAGKFSFPRIPKPYIKPPRRFQANAPCSPPTFEMGIKLS